jgi:hypothetical protein
LTDSAEQARGQQGACDETRQGPTKTGEDRIVELCPRALEVLKRHLSLRTRLKLEGLINHEDLFFHDSGRPIRDLNHPYDRWRWTLRVTL